MVVFWYPKDFNQHSVQAEELENNSTLLHITDVEGQEHKIQVDSEGYKRWSSGGLIQNCLPQLSSTERELIISGFTDKTWKDIENKK